MGLFLKPRRDAYVSQIASTLINLEADGVELDYMQADVTSLPTVRDTLAKIYDEYGPIHTMIFVAASHRNTPLNAVTQQDVVSAMKSIAIGAWNVHAASEELKLNVERFVMLNSIRYFIVIGSGIVLTCYRKCIPRSSWAIVASRSKLFHQCPRCISVIYFTVQSVFRAIRPLGISRRIRRIC